MKKIGMGIAVILFGILLEISVEGHLAYIAWAIGLIGLGLAVGGFVEKENP